MDFDIFGRNITDKVRNQRTLYCATSNNVCFCTTWQMGNTKIAFFTQVQVLFHCVARIQLEMWANAQRDGRPAEYRWRPLFNAAKFG